MRTVIFDMDGVIVDSEPLHIRHLHEYLRRLGVEHPEKFDKNLKGVSARDTWKMLSKEYNFDKDIDYLIRHSRESYIDFLNSIDDLPAISGVIELIKAFKSKGYQMGVGSSAAPKRIDLFLKKLHVKSYFKTLISGDDVKHSKPAPDIFLLVAKSLGADPKDCLVIEDASNGVEASHAAGMKCIAYAGSDHNKDDLSKADHITKDFNELAKMVLADKLPI